MQTLRQILLWNKFEKSGSVTDYLRYCNYYNNINREEYHIASDNRRINNKRTEAARGYQAFDYIDS